MTDSSVILCFQQIDSWLGDLQLDLGLLQLLLFTNYKKEFLLGFHSRDMKKKPISSYKRRL